MMAIKHAVVGVLLAGTVLSVSQTAQAINEADCAIWLCLPQGFPGADCKPPLREYIRRITSKPPKPPLPSMGSCVVGLNSGSSQSLNGFYYTEGREEYYPCKSGYTFRPATGGKDGTPATCSKSRQNNKGDTITESYNAIKREHPEYVIVYVDGKPQKHPGTGPTRGSFWHIEDDRFWYRR